MIDCCFFELGEKNVNSSPTIAYLYPASIALLLLKVETDVCSKKLSEGYREI